MAQTSTHKTLSGLLSFLIAMGAVLPVGLLSSVPLANAATFTVANTNDAGAGSLRQAIIDANLNAGLDTIVFEGTLSGTIILASDLPTFNEAIIIDGTTAQDALAGPDIVLNAAGRNHCLRFDSGAGNVLKGITCTGANEGIVLTQNVSGATIGGTNARDPNEINNCGSSGLSINGADNVNVIGNKIGTAGGNTNGISINNNSTGLIIGGNTLAARNTIVNSTNHGINMLSASATIRGNYIGTADGNADNGNGGSGIFVGTGVTNTLIGGNTAGDRNVISGNNQSGVWVSGSNGIVISGNYIGTRADGAGDLGNSQNGVRLESSNNMIGGNTAAEGNVISGNDQGGVRIDASMTTANTNTIKNNYIGLNSLGNGTIANTGSGVDINGGSALNTNIEANVISGNSQAGIIIGGATHTGTTIYGNTIGLMSDKTTAAGNNQEGIRVGGDSTIIGAAGDASKVNIISSNGAQGIAINGADNVTVTNNIIGWASDVTTPRTNVQDAILISNTAASNTIGGTTAGSGNKINSANFKFGVFINGNAGNFNFVRLNNLAGAGQVNRVDPANESIATPTINPASTTSQVFGTAPANSVVEVFANGNSVGSTVTADANGNWVYNGKINENNKLSALATNANKSTSASSPNVSVVLDSTAPTVPTVTSHANDIAINTNTVSLSGTKEANTSIWIDGVQIVLNDTATTWTASNYALVEGQNNLSIVAKDFTLNTSAALAFTITRDTSIPTAPILSYTLNGNGTATITGSGTEFAGNVYVNDVDSGVNVDNLGNFTVPSVVLQAGNNTISITIKDNAGNTSPASILSITLVIA